MTEKKTILRKKAHINRKYCVACGVCANTCPMEAITIEDGKYAFVDTTKCVSCKKCINLCPASTIEII